jgi:hypothetical protein
MVDPVLEVMICGDIGCVIDEANVLCVETFFKASVTPNAAWPPLTLEVANGVE